MQGARIGVYRRCVTTPTTDTEILSLFNKALIDLQKQGAIVVDPFLFPHYKKPIKDSWTLQAMYDINCYLSSFGDEIVLKDLQKIHYAHAYSPSIKKYLEYWIKLSQQNKQTTLPLLDIYHHQHACDLRQDILNAMDKDNLDAFVYPTRSNPPIKIGDTKSPAGDNSQILAPLTGFPALSVPMGWTQNNLPSGLQFVGRLLSEPLLPTLAYAFEQATHHRKPPEYFPPL